MKKLIIKLFPGLVRSFGLFKVEILAEYEELKVGGKISYLDLIKSIYNYLVYGSSLSESYFLHFETLSAKGKNKFVTMRRNRKLDKLFNSSKANSILWNKVLFNNHFASFIKRPFLYVDCHTSDSEIQEFFNKANKAIAKPNDLYYGIGVRKIDTLQDLMNLRDNGSSFIVEGLLSNHPSLDVFNDTSLNTLRVVTCIDTKGNVHIVAILLRTGCKGALIDNLKGGGICWHVDTSTGVIDYPGRNGLGEYFVTHPTSGICGPGFKIPCFEELKKLALKLALHLHEARYVGWDIAITPNGLEVIEGNVCPSAELIQCNGIGLLNQIKMFI